MVSFLEKLKKGMGAKELSEKDFEKPKEEYGEEKETGEEKEEIARTEEKIEPAPEPETEKKPAKKDKKQKKITEKIKMRKEKKTEPKKDFLAEMEIKKISSPTPAQAEKVRVSEEKDPLPAPPKIKEESKIGIKREKKWFEPEGQLTVDAYQTENEIVIQSAVAGIRPEELDISIENDVLTIRGNREKTEEKEEKNYFYQECYWGRFSREIILPSEVDSSRTEAIMQNGILTIRIPKIEREKKRKIVVK